jgi:hypothetical protein
MAYKNQKKNKKHARKLHRTFDNYYYRRRQGMIADNNRKQREEDFEAFRKIAKRMGTIGSM